MEGGISAVEDLILVRCFGFLFVVVVGTGDGVLLQISTYRSGFSLSTAGQGEEYTTRLE